MILEVCAFNIQSCLIAEKSGAARVELCADPLEGGTTPGYGLIQYAITHLSIPVFPMIRRGGDFIYDADEITIMKKDILLCRELGCKGIATGVQLPNGKMDTEQLKRIVEWAHPMAVTCHKVFDGAPDGFEALEDVITAGCSRVLTSGLRKTAVEGADVIKKLISQAAGRIIVMPGGSIRSSNIMQLIEETGAPEYHSSGIIARGANNISDEQEVTAIVNCLLK